MPTDLDNMVMDMAMRCWPKGWFASRFAPETFTELVQQYGLFGKISVRKDNSDRTIFSEPKYNQAFRAWHDWTHLTYMLDFTFEHEKQTCWHQQSRLLSLYGTNGRTKFWCSLIEADVIGQAEYEARHGMFPEDQKGFVQAYIVDRNAALSAEWK